MVREMRKPTQEATRNWRAGCAKRCKSGSGRGGWKRTVFSKLLDRGILSKEVGGTYGTSLAAYFTPGPSNRLSGSVIRKCPSSYLRMRGQSAALQPLG